MIYYIHIISDRYCQSTVAFILFDTKCFILIMSRLVVFASRPVEQFLSVLKSQLMVACFAAGRYLLELVDSVRCGACLELLCERGYSQLDSSGVGEAVRGYILYIFMLRRWLWEEAIICCWGKL